MSDDYQIFLERIEMISDELEKIKRGIIAVSEGRSWDEAFNEEVYLEANNIKSSISTMLMRMIEHLFKIKYYHNDVNDTLTDGWLKEVEKFKLNVYDTIEWYDDKPILNLVYHLKSNLEKIYKNAIKEYKKDAKKYSDLQDGLRYIPEECPWTLEDLMEKEIEDLISDKYLPNREGD